MRYKGKGEHSVRELELIIEQQAEELHLLRANHLKELKSAYYKGYDVGLKKPDVWG